MSAFATPKQELSLCYDVVDNIVTYGQTFEQKEASRNAKERRKRAHFGADAHRNCGAPRQFPGATRRETGNHPMITHSGHNKNAEQRQEMFKSLISGSERRYPSCF